MPYHPDDPPLATVGPTKTLCPTGVRVWCHNQGCARQDVCVIVPWDKIPAPDDAVFIELKFRCSVCGEAKTTFMPDWPEHKRGLGADHGAGPYGGALPERDDVVIVPIPANEGEMSDEDWKRLMARESDS